MILVLSDLWLPFPGGAERLIYNLSRALLREHPVVALTSYERAEKFSGPPLLIRSVGIKAEHDQGAAEIAMAIEEERPDVLLTHHLFAYEFETELAATGLPIVQIVLNTRRIRCAALAVFISRYVRHQLEWEPGDLTVLPPAYDDVRADRHGDAIGFIKPIEHKGADLFYKIAARCPDRRFVVLRGEWQTLEDIRPAPNIEFMEPVEDIRDFWQECRVVLVPSVSEDAGTVSQEATVNGLPCISSRVGGLAETNRGGILVREREASVWAARIARLDDPRYYQSVVARQRINQAVNERAVDKFVDRVLGLLP